MQPTYLPWCGYFDLIDQVDCFVILDSVQFDRRSWQQRNRILTDQGPKWLTVPVKSKGLRDQKISDVEIDETAGFASRHLETIRHAYRRTPYFGEYFPNLEQRLSEPSARLVDLNTSMIGWLCEQLGIGWSPIWSSTLNPTGEKAELLLDVCQKVEADAYLSPVGAADYIGDGELFQANGVTLKYQSFTHPGYSQANTEEFVSHMSVLDLLFNCGPDAINLIRAGRDQA